MHTTNNVKLKTTTKKQIQITRDLTPQFARKQMQMEIMEHVQSPVSTRIRLLGFYGKNL